MADAHALGACGENRAGSNPASPTNDGNSMKPNPTIASIPELLERFDAFAFDSFGVLVDGIDPLPGAIQLIAHLCQADVPFVVATNDASKLTETRTVAMRKQGFDVELENVVTSGSLLRGWAEAHGLTGCKVIATGKGEAVEYVRLAGMEPVALSSKRDDIGGLVIAGIQGYDWETALSDIVTLLYRNIDAGTHIHGAVPNPDVLYPDGTERYAIGPGGLAGLIEQAMERGFGATGTPWTFDRLGKPHAPMFDEIKSRLPVGANVAFFGDQLHTDIAGANAAGFASVLTGTGITRWHSPHDFAEVSRALTPQILLPSLAS